MRKFFLFVLPTKLLALSFPKKEMNLTVKPIIDKVKTTTFHFSGKHINREILPSYLPCCKEILLAFSHVSHVFELVPVNLQCLYRDVGVQKCRTGTNLIYHIHRMLILISGPIVCVEWTQVTYNRF